MPRLRLPRITVDVTLTTPCACVDCGNPIAPFSNVYMRELRAPNTADEREPVKVSQPICTGCFVREMGRRRAEVLAWAKAEGLAPPTYTTSRLGEIVARGDSVDAAIALAAP